MSNLISRSAVIEVLKQTGIIQDNDLGHLVVDEINRIPTAYSVEKVVAELEKERDLANHKALETVRRGMPLSSDKQLIKKHSFERALEIVRKGGAE